MINSTIGKYKITRLIGEGGMASIYEAEHEMLGTKVAIKVLNPVLSSNMQIKERFRNEAKLMASLDHPNITKVIDFDEQPQQLSIVMEFLNGEDLNQKIKKNGALSEKEITEVFSQTLSAFQYAHDKGIIHRDIKPSNIFILSNGNVKILDFGIAKLFGQGIEMTQTGAQIGTPVYMSPEQVKADKSIDQRSDIYSLGVTMFYAINGKPPYDSDTDSQFDIFTKIVYEPLPAFSVQSKFKATVLKACQKKREERFHSCREWLTELKSNNINELNNEDKTLMNNTNKDQSELEKSINETIKTDVYGLDNKSSETLNQTAFQQKNKISTILFSAVGGVVLIILVFFLVNLEKKDKDLTYINSTDIVADSSGISAALEKINIDSAVLDKQKESNNDLTGVNQDKLVGRHKLSLQWISWDIFGYVDFVKTGENTYEITGYQDGNKSNGECNKCYLKINGTVKKISEKELSFTGRIESSVTYIQKGVPCIKEGTLTFKSTQNRKYWRLQEMDGCEGVTNYVDIYF